LLLLDSPKLFFLTLAGVFQQCALPRGLFLGAQTGFLSRLLLGDFFLLAGLDRASRQCDFERGALALFQTRLYLGE
jgi:hypothetical protein